MEVWFSLPESINNRSQGAHLQSMRVFMDLTFIRVESHRVRKDELDILRKVSVRMVFARLGFLPFQLFLR